MVQDSRISAAIGITGPLADHFEKGQVMRALVSGYNEEKRGLILGLKRLSLEAAAQGYPIGSEVNATVTYVCDDYAFLEIEEGLQGFVHISEVSWEYVESVQSKLAVGQRLRVKVVEHNMERGRLTCSRKAVLPDPWSTFGKKPGDTVRAEVAGFVEGGTLVKMAEGVVGYLRNADVSWTEYVEDASEFLNIGDVIAVKIMSLDRASRKTRVSKKELERDPRRNLARRYKPGDVVTVEVVKLYPHGIKAKLPDGIVSFIPVRYGFLSQEQIRELRQGQKVECCVSRVDEQRGKLELFMPDEP